MSTEKYSGKTSDRVWDERGLPGSLLWGLAGTRAVEDGWSEQTYGIRDEGSNFRDTSLPRNNSVGVRSRFSAAGADRSVQ